MINKTYKHILSVASRDDRLSTYHLALLLVIVCLSNKPHGIETIYTSRRILMKYTRIKSIATYHKTLNDLVSLGYLSYRPSYHPLQKSKFALIEQNLTIILEPDKFEFS